MSATFFLLFALLSWAGLGVFHKIADFKGCRPLSVTVVLFACAATVFWIYTLVIKRGVEQVGLIPPFTVYAIGLAAFFGAMAAFGILTFQIGIRYGRLTTSWLIVNLSTLIPSALSLIVYKEYEQAIKWQHPVALVLIMASIFLLWRDKVLELRQGSVTATEGLGSNVV